MLIEKGVERAEIDGSRLSSNPNRAQVSAWDEVTNISDGSATRSLNVAGGPAHERRGDVLDLDGCGRLCHNQNRILLCGSQCGDTGADVEEVKDLRTTTQPCVDRMESCPAPRARCLRALRWSGRDMDVKTIIGMDGA